MVNVRVGTLMEADASEMLENDDWRTQETLDMFCKHQ